MFNLIDLIGLNFDCWAEYQKDILHGKRPNCVSECWADLSLLFDERVLDLNQNLD